MGMLKEFKDFAMRGNVIDLAVGVIIGGAFGKITESVINDLFMPVIGKVVGNVDFSNLYVVLSGNIPEGTALADAKKLGAVFAWGNFVTVLINFMLLALCVFLMIKGINSMKKKEEAAPAAPAPPSEEVTLLREIRDSLKK